MHAVRSFTFGSLFCSRWLHSAGKPWRQVTSPSACGGPRHPLPHHSNRGNRGRTASAPRTVRVCPGTYTEQVSITSRSLSKALRRGPPTQRWWQRLRVPGYKWFGYLRQPGGGPDLCPGCDRVTVSHMTVDGSNDQLVDCSIDRWNLLPEFQRFDQQQPVRNVLMPSAYRLPRRPGNQCGKRQRNSGHHHLK